MNIKRKKFEQIVIKYEKLIYSICYNLLKNKEESENMAQETFLSLYKNLDKYIDLDENEIKNIICRIAINKCKDYFKSKISKIQENISDIEDIEIQSDENIEEKLLKEEEKKHINKIINELKSPYKEVLIEYYLKEKSLDEVSEKLNISKGTLKMQIHRGKNILKEKLLNERSLE